MATICSVLNYCVPGTVSVLKPLSLTHKAQDDPVPATSVVPVLSPCHAALGLWALCHSCFPAGSNSTWVCSNVTFSKNALPGHPIWNSSIPGHFLLRKVPHFLLRTYWHIASTSSIFNFLLMSVTGIWVPGGQGCVFPRIVPGTQ